MRVLVLSTYRDWTMSVRVLMTMGAGMAARGEQVMFVCCRGSNTEREIAHRFPDIPIRTLSGAFTTGRALRLRALGKAVRPNAVLVHTENDAFTAALALGRRAGIIQRLGIGQRFTRSWRAKFTASRTRALVMGDEIGESVHLDTHVRTAVSWPSIPTNASEHPFGVGNKPPVIAIVAGKSMHPAQHAAGAAALRAAARIVSRHPELRVLLLGDTHRLQALRVHAGALGLAERLTVLPLETLLTPVPFTASAVWVTAMGDEGAVSIVASMMRRIPVIVPRGFDTESLVAQRITGFVADDTDLAGSVSSLAHLMADNAEHQAMGAACAARAERLHSFDAALTRTIAALSGVAA